MINNKDSIHGSEDFGQVKVRSHGGCEICLGNLWIVLNGLSHIFNRIFKSGKNFLFLLRKYKGELYVFGIDENDQCKSGQIWKSLKEEKLELFDGEIREDYESISKIELVKMFIAKEQRYMETSSLCFLKWLREENATALTIGKCRLYESRFYLAVIWSLDFMRDQRKGSIKGREFTEWFLTITKTQNCESYCFWILRDNLVLITRGDLVNMAQIMVKAGKVPVVRTAVVKIASLDVERRIQQFHLTLIGRAWNPQCQNMESLLDNMPKIWKLEDRVTGVDIGDGKFHFEFQSEEELQDVLQNGPYLYDAWMVSLVRWEPVVDKNYPSDITFWARVKGLPIHLGGAASLWAVGDAVGKTVNELL